MTNKLEQNKAIIADAPEGASHIEESSSLFIKVTENDNLPFFNTWWIYEDGSWVENDSYNILLMRKIDDIRENIALQERVLSGSDERIKELEQEVKDLERGQSSFLALLEILPHIEEPMLFLSHWTEGDWDVCHEWDDEINGINPDLFDAIFEAEQPPAQEA